MKKDQVILGYLGYKPTIETDIVIKPFCTFLKWKLLEMPLLENYKMNQ